MDKFFWLTQKYEKLTGQLVGQETDQNHMDVPNVLNFRTSFLNNLGLNAKFLKGCSTSYYT